MRILRFNVNAQQITPDPHCDFSGLVPGTSGYLKAQFDFSPEWSGCKKAASFWLYGKEHATPVVNGECEIPKGALTGQQFRVSVTGMRGDYRITTNKVIVQQGG